MVQSPDVVQGVLLRHLSTAQGNAYSSKCIIFVNGSLLCILAVIPESPLPKGSYAQKLQVQPGPAFPQRIFIAVAMLTNYLIVWINTLPPKPVEATETICCNVFPPTARATFQYLEEARPPRRDFHLKQQLMI